jgi:hypothetical protein
MWFPRAWGARDAAEEVATSGWSPDGSAADLKLEQGQGGSLVGVVQENCGDGVVARHLGLRVVPNAPWSIA